MSGAPKRAFIVKTRLYRQDAPFVPQRCASLLWLSSAPHEREFLFPPCTYLKPSGRKQKVDVAEGVTCMVVEVVPHF